MELQNLLHPPAYDEKQREANWTHPPPVIPQSQAPVILNQNQPIQYLNHAQPLPVGGGCPQFAYRSPAVPDVCQNYSTTQSLLNGILQIAVALTCIVSNSVVLGLRYTIYFIVSYGIWGGVVILVAGSLGIAAATLKKKSLIIAFMAFCILSSCMAIVILTISVMGFIYSEQGYDWYHEDATALNSVLIGAVIEGGLSVWGSVICCAAVCCGANQQVVTPAQVYGVVGPNGQVILVANPQPINVAALQQPINVAALPNGGVSTGF